MEEPAKLGEVVFHQVTEEEKQMTQLKSHLSERKLEVEMNLTSLLPTSSFCIDSLDYWLFKPLSCKPISSISAKT